MNLRRLLVAFGLGAGAAALAGDAAMGERMFTQNCQSCHIAQQTLSPQLARLKRAGDKGARGAPDLTEVVRAKGLDHVERWLKNPWSINEQTACETRTLPAGNRDDLLIFLATRRVQQVPPLQERMKQELEAKGGGSDKGGGRNDHGGRNDRGSRNDHQGGRPGKENRK